MKKAIENSKVLALTEKEYRVLTWMEDVEGLTNRIEGSELVIFYHAMPSYWEHRLALDYVADAIHDMFDIQDEMNFY